MGIHFPIVAIANAKGIQPVSKTTADTHSQNKSHAMCEARGAASAFLVMVGVVVFWLWLFFAVIQPWLDGV